MLKSYIKSKNGNSVLYIDDEPMTAMAYTTYFEERSCYEDFIDAGYRIFFVNVSMTSSPINSAHTGFTPFNVGVFENPEEPDYSEFEDAVEKILKKCPTAVIFPRIYVSMPQWWVKANPEETVLTPKGGYREILFSKAFRKDGAELLVRMVHHIKKGKYANRIGGWQLCGGNTQEWFHHDLNGSLCEAAEEPFRQWVKDTYGDEDARLPSLEELRYCGDAVQRSENARRYCIFCNLGVAETLEHFAKTLKEETDHTQVVGAFYGYCFESGGAALYGSHAIRSLLGSENLDFFSSPNAYLYFRSFGIDWGDMLPVDSIRHHGKLCFIECDIRTYLTESIQSSRPGRYPEDIYKTNAGKSVWLGPPTPELSREALRKCFAHQITKASAIWWFDMWGGWYHDKLLLSEMTEMKKIYDCHCVPDEEILPAEVVLFADERGFANLFSYSPQIGGITKTRTAMGNTGAPFDSFLAEDAERILSGYKAAVFPCPVPSEAGLRAMELCEKMGIPYLSATPEHYELTSGEIQNFLRKCGIHLYTENEDVVYAGNGYLGFHSATEGRKTIKLPKRCYVFPIFGTDVAYSDTDIISFALEKDRTVLFSVKEPLNQR